MKVFFLIIVALYVLYLTFLIVRACSELKNMPYSGYMPLSNNNKKKVNHRFVYSFWV